MTDERWKTLLRADDGGRRVPGRHRLQEGLQPGVRQQGRRRVTMVAAAGAARRARSFRSATSPSSSRTARSPFAGSISICATASSSACSGPRAAASRRCCASSPGSARRAPARSSGRPRRMTASGEPQPDLGFVFQDPTLMPWANALRNTMLPLTLAGVGKRRGGSARGRNAGAGRAQGLREILPARTLRRHEDARLDRARAGDAPEDPADGRAVRGARRDHAPQAQRRPAGAVVAEPFHRRVRHPFGVRVGLSLAAHRRDGGAARAA